MKEDNIRNMELLLCESKHGEYEKIADAWAKGSRTARSSVVLSFFICFVFEFV